MTERTPIHFVQHRPAGKPPREDDRAVRSHVRHAISRGKRHRSLDTDLSMITAESFTRKTKSRAERSQLRSSHYFDKGQLNAKHGNRPTSSCSPLNHGHVDDLPSGGKAGYAVADLNSWGIGGNPTAYHTFTTYASRLIPLPVERLDGLFKSGR
jgi:hypothetical protein